jgi:hypothetical protein
LRSKAIEIIKKIMKNKYIGELLGVAILILSIVALTIGPAFIREHAGVIIVLLVLIMVVSGAAT